MRFLLRLLLLLVLGTYLLNHYGSFIRANLWRVYSGGNDGIVSRVLPAIGVDHPQDELARTNTPPGALPRRDLTPGAIDPRVTQHNIRKTICWPGYTAAVRPPFAYTDVMKRRLMQVYGVQGSIHDYELDHLIPLELGGCPECETNLWPQSRTVFPGAGEKDEVEDYLHHQVCSGKLSLAEAQREISSDWYAVYRRLHREAARERNEGE